MGRQSIYPKQLTDTVYNARYIHIYNGPKIYHATEDNPIRHHIFMITGNPGCIGYYHDFLVCLNAEISNVWNKSSVSIYGTSLSGFVDNERPVLGLQGQIEYLEECLNGYIEQHVINDPRTEHQVILIGHSVGAYIGLELIRRHREHAGTGTDRGFQILGYVGLWPTITHIAKSKRGRRAGWLLKLPIFAALISALAKILMFLLGSLILGDLFIVLILKKLGFPERPANVTAKFLTTRKGVYQALYMAGDEMREITVDRWDEDVWGASTAEPKYARPKLVFYFGQDDYWVANHCRDELIKARGYFPGRENWRPRMIIDDQGIDHAFCIHHSNVVAKRTAGWISDMIDGVS